MSHDQQTTNIIPQGLQGPQSALINQDPVVGLVEYVNEIKPYHTKIIDILVEYVYDENIFAGVGEDLFTEITIDQDLQDKNAILTQCRNLGFGQTFYGGPARFPVSSPDRALDILSFPAVQTGTNSYVIIVGDVREYFRINSEVELRSFVFDTTTQSIVSNIPGMSGFFTVTNIEYHPGSIDSWSGYPDPTTYKLGLQQYTKLYLSPDLGPIPTLGPNQTIIITVFPKKIPLSGVMYYSNVNFDTPDEGLLRRDIVDYDTVLNGFIVNGSLLPTNIVIGEQLQVRQSTNNNGFYTILDIVYDNTTNKSTVVVAEPIDYSVTDGVIEVVVPSNVLLVRGDVTNTFTQGQTFKIIGGSLAGEYTALYSYYIPFNDVTKIRVAESLIPKTTQGYPILNATGNTITVGGNPTSTLFPGDEIIIVRSNYNDDLSPLNIVSITYDSITETTTIEVDKTVKDDTTGEILKFSPGEIQVQLFGYDEAKVFCPKIPNLAVRVYVDDKLTINQGSEFSFEDDIIVFGTENTDPGSQIFYSLVNVSLTEPPVPSQLTPPVSPSTNDFWFDTNTNTLKIYRGDWKPVTTIYWYNPAVNTIYYRTKTQSVDTGWLLYSETQLGMNVVKPGIGSLKKIYQENVFNTTNQSNFTVTLPTPLPGTEKNNTRVFASGVPVNFDIITSTEIQIYSFVRENTTIRVEYYDNVRQEENAIVIDSQLWDLEPNQIVYNNVEIYKSPDRIVLNNGNFVNKLIRNRQIEVSYNTETYSEQYTVDVFPILEIDYPNRILRVQGDFDATTNDIITVYSNEQRHRGNYTVNAVSYDSITNITSIVVNESIEKIVNWERPVPIVSIDSTTDTITVQGNITNTLIPGQLLTISGSTVNNDGIYTIASTNYDSANDLTEITIAEPIADSSISGIVSFEVQNNPSTSYGNVFGSYYRPDNNQTIALIQQVLPDPLSNIPDYATHKVYFFQVEVESTLDDLISNNTRELLGISNETSGQPIQYQVLYTDATNNYFEIQRIDPTSGLPVDLTDSFPPGREFRLINSYSTQPTTIETNDGLYVVQSSTYDPLTGRTRIYIENDLAKIPPYGTFTITQINLSGGPNGEPQIVLSGDHTNIFKVPPTKTYRLDVPLFSTNIEENVVSVVSVSASGGQTYLNLDRTPLDTTYTGPVKFGESEFHITIHYDQTNTTTWNDGIITNEVFASVGQREENTVSTSIIDSLSFVWGTVYYWPIIAIDTGTQSVTVSGDLTGALYPNDTVKISGSVDNDGTYTVSSVTYNNVTNESTIVFVELLPGTNTSPFGTLYLDQADISQWYQYKLISTDPATNSIYLYGNATSNIQTGNEIRLLGTQSSDGVYTVVSSPVYDSTLNLTEIVVNSITNFENKGFVEPARSYQIHVFYTDSINSVINDVIEPIVPTTGRTVEGFGSSNFDIDDFDSGQ